MTTIVQSYGSVRVLSRNWIELELEPTLEVEPYHFDEFERLLRAETDRPFVILCHCRSEHSLEMGIQHRLAELDGCLAVAAVPYTKRAREITEELDLTANAVGVNFAVFQSDSEARDWLEEELAGQGRGYRSVRISL